MKYQVNFIEYHCVEVEAKDENDAYDKAYEVLEKGEAGDTYLNMEFKECEVE